MDNNVQLTISKDIVNPIVEAKIKEAILSAMGGGEELIHRVTEQILYQKVNSDGKVSSYQSENKLNWIDVIVTSQIKSAVSDAIKEIIAERQDEIKESIKKIMSTKKGIEAFTQALLAGTAKMTEKYSSTISVEFKDKQYRD